ncbi:MAG: ATP-dependent helicase C-terminal domain-containing protein, partial [Gemmobacter sp.]
VCGGLELLDPGQKPLAATSDLASFWKSGYPLARKDLRGRYPRHVWPEDGAAAEVLGAPRHPATRALCGG